MFRVEKVAMPETAATVAVPESVAPAVPLPDVIVSVTLAVNVGSVLPDASFAVTVTAGVMVAPAAVVEGWFEKTRWLGGPAVTSNEPLVAPVGPVADALRVYASPALLMLRLVKDATPATAGTDGVPVRVPPAGLLAIAIVTIPAKPVATLPWASRAVTSTCGVIALPAATLLGCTVKASCDAVPPLMLNGPHVADCSPVAVAVSV